MKLPYQVLFGCNPSLQGLEIFGTTVYPYIRPYNENKLQPITSLCFFVGFAMGYKGVICFHRQSRKFIISRHVIHDETLFLYKNVDLARAQVSSNTHTSRSSGSLIVVTIPVQNMHREVQIQYVNENQHNIDYTFARSSNDSNIEVFAIPE